MVPNVVMDVRGAPVLPSPWEVSRSIWYWPDAYSAESPDIPIPPKRRFARKLRSNSDPRANNFLRGIICSLRKQTRRQICTGSAFGNLRAVGYISNIKMSNQTISFFVT